MMIRLSFLSEEEQLCIASCCQQIEIAKGEVLFHPGDKAEGLFFLEEGKLGVQTRTGFEDKTQVVALLDPGAIVGEKGLLESATRGMTVLAIKHSVLQFLSKSSFAELEKNQPQLAIKLLKEILKITAIRLNNISVRLAHVL